MGLNLDVFMLLLFSNIYKPKRLHYIMSNKIRTAYSDLEIKALLDKAPEADSELIEDFMIDQGDGTRACFNWELRNKGYNFVDQDQTYQTMSDEELLKDAQNQLDSYKIQRDKPQNDNYNTDYDNDFY